MDGPEEELEKKAQSLLSLKSDLEHSTSTHLEPDDPLHFVSAFSNDLEIAKNIPNIIERVETQRVDGLRVGLVIGSGGLLTLGPRLPQIDLWIVLDKSSSEIDMLRKYHEEVAKADNPEELLALAVNFGAGNFRGLPKTLLDEQQSYGPHHYLHSLDNLRLTQEFLARRNVVYQTANLTDIDYMTGIGEILKKNSASLVFVNMTNVMEWIPGFYKNESQQVLKLGLDQLPITPDCVFLHGISKGRIGRSPIITSIAVGLDNYLKATKIP